MSDPLKIVHFKYFNMVAIIFLELPNNIYSFKEAYKLSSFNYNTKGKRKNKGK